MRDCAQCNSFKGGVQGHANLFNEVKEKFVAEVKKRSLNDAKQNKPGSDYYKEMATQKKNVGDLVAKFGTKNCPHRTPNGACPNQDEASTILRGMTSPY